MTGRAVVSIDGIYRYTLERLFQPQLDSNRGRLLFVMLNPSTADALVDDPTIGRCVRFARDWGYTELAVVNLFAFRTPDPAVLYACIRDREDPVGPDNDVWILEEARRADLVVCAWGQHGNLGGRDRSVLQILCDAGKRPYVLGVTAEGRPRHPLYMPASTVPRPL